MLPSGSDAEIDTGALTEADLPALLALAAECTALAPRTQVKLYGAIGVAPIKVRFERDKRGRLEVQVRGIPAASRAARGSRNVPVALEFVKDGTR